MPTQTSPFCYVPRGFLVLWWILIKEGGIQKKARVLSKNPFNSLPTHGPEAAVLGQAHHRPLRSPGSLSLQQRCRGRKTWQWTLSKEGSALKKCVCLFLEVRVRTRVAKARSSILVKSRALPQLHCWERGILSILTRYVIHSLYRMAIKGFQCQWLTKSATSQVQGSLVMYPMQDQNHQIFVTLWIKLRTVQSPRLTRAFSPAPTFLERLFAVLTIEFPDPVCIVK